MTGMSEEEAEQFECEIGMRPNPERDAREALRAYQEQQGIVFDNPDAPVAPDAKAMAMAEDEELNATSTWMGGPRRG
jgi:hypothetical protein